MADRLGARIINPPFCVCGESGSPIRAPFFTVTIIPVCVTLQTMDIRHQTDFYGWTQEQAALARSRSANALDWDNIALELETLGKTEVRELRSRFVVLMSHLLKLMMQPER
jgi:hypothetical protein